MKCLYISTSGDTTLELPVPLEVDGYVCGIIEMAGQLKRNPGDIFLCSDICEESQEKQLCLYCKELDVEVMY